MTALDYFGQRDSHSYSSQRNFITSAYRFHNNQQRRKERHQKSSRSKIVTTGQHKDSLCHFVDSANGWKEKK